MKFVSPYGNEPEANFIGGPSQSGRAPPTEPGMTLHGFLVRLIWLCVLPPLLLACYLAFDRVDREREAFALEAKHIASSVVAGIDFALNARTGALGLLAASPLADDPARWTALRLEALAFQRNLGGHVVFADPTLATRFHTLDPLDEQSLTLDPHERAAAQGALATGRATVAGFVLATPTRRPSFSLAVPGIRYGEPAFVLVATFGVDSLQTHLDEPSLPEGWSAALISPEGEPIAQRVAGNRITAGAAVEQALRFAATSEVHPWSVRVEIPHEIHRRPIIAAITGLALAIVAAALLGILGGLAASRRLTRAIHAAVAPAAGDPSTPVPEITEIAEVRNRLEHSATARAAVEDELRELNASLEQRVEQRTTELTQLNQELDSFAYAVSHDLRAPLRAMTGFANALKEDYGERLDGEAGLYLEQIDLAARKMGNLIEGLLSLSRSTRGELHTERMDVSAMARAALVDLAQSDPQRRVSVDIEPDLVLYGSPRMTERLLANLLENAWKYTAHATQPWIRVQAGQVDGRAGVCIRDNGAGFDMAHAERLFQPFQRMHRQDEFPGLGIGLATVQRIVRRHGGAIQACAEPGAGACFCFTLAAEGASS